MTRPKYPGREPGIKCPHCRGKTVVRDSVEVTRLVRELRIACADDDCGFTGVAQLSVIRQVRPSAKPDAEVRLPFGSWSKAPANDDHPTPANDQTQRRVADTGLGAALASVMT